IIMTIYGILCGYTDFINMADFLQLNEDYFINLLSLENGIPSHDTFSRVFASLNPKELMNIFINWIKDITKDKGLHVALDGKAIKSARDKINNGNIPYILSGFLCNIGLSIGQIKVDDKSNEITTIPELLDLIDVRGKIITNDAIGTQEDIASIIVINKKASYILKVKDNQKDLKDDIKTYFDLEIKKDSSDIAIAETDYEKNHSRIEKRTYYISYDTDCISDKVKWKTVKAIGRIDVYREENNKVSITQNYYILSEKFNIDRFINITIEHWNIECSLHWRLDVILDEDHSTNKKDNSIDNLAIIRKIVFNLAKLDNSMGNLTLKKKMTRYVFNFRNIENLLFNVICSI
ncbi:MAG: ISAs1 family transposase, partial [Bacilli bacterium]|nr:ISAs1 family transposase [Bacilli bacterium]